FPQFANHVGLLQFRVEGRGFGNNLVVIKIAEETWYLLVKFDPTIDSPLINSIDSHGFCLFDFLVPPQRLDVRPGVINSGFALEGVSQCDEADGAAVSPLRDKRRGVLLFCIRNFNRPEFLPSFENGIELLFAEYLSPV